MATCYDGDGSHFIVHRDNTCDATAAASWASGSTADGCINAREATAILYHLRQIHIEIVFAKTLKCLGLTLRF